MSVAPMGADSAGYYVGMVLDVEDYYLQPSEEPGRWHGPAAADLGLTGRVERADLEALLDGRDPRTGTRIGTWTKRPAYDLTLSAPKSVSLMWGLGDRGVASTVELAHDRAVEAAFAYLDEYACVVRRGHGGTIRFDGDGLIAAVFRHRTSRALDPDLHSHVLVANMTRGADGEWSCPFGTLLFKHARAAGCIYQSVLRRELSERLGVRFGEVTKGSADIVGIDRPARRALSLDPPMNSVFEMVAYPRKVPPDLGEWRLRSQPFTPDQGGTSGATSIARDRPGRGDLRRRDLGR
jgi:conjugative relaxase-like TrwC/TraI family protein